jgi:hypothetical protein
MEKSHINLCVVNKAAIDKRITKIIIRHGILIDSKHFIDFKLFILDLLL